MSKILSPRIKCPPQSNESQLYKVDIRGIFSWEALEPGDFVFLNSPTPGVNVQLCPSHFTIPLRGPESYPWGKSKWCVHDRPESVLEWAWSQKGMWRWCYTVFFGLKCASTQRFTIQFYARIRNWSWETMINVINEQWVASPRELDSCG